MKKMNKGAISIFALLSMMFFLIFIMVAYNNVTQKGKNQVETQEILVRYYKSNRTAADIADAMNGDKSSQWAIYDGVIMEVLIVISFAINADRSTEQSFER